MNLIIDGLEMMGKQKSALAAFERPLNEAVTLSPTRGFSGATGLAEGCMGWIWWKWLQAAPALEIRPKIDGFIARGLEMYRRSPSQRMRGTHDMFLLHCAIFASSDKQLLSVAEQVIDSRGNGGEEPINDGDLYASAWCGMLKHWILGNTGEAISQSNLVWNAYRPPTFRAAPKPMVTKWLADEWDGFRREQQKDFDKRWSTARKTGIASAEKGGTTTVHVTSFSVAQLWTWAHCGLAMLAHRKGVPVVTDPFWLPPAATEEPAG